MKILPVIGALILTASALPAQIPLPAPVASQTPATLSGTHIFSSEMGFHFAYSSDWNVQDLSPILPLMKLQSATPGNCVERLFNAKLGEPASFFNVIGETTQCLGRKPDLSDLALIRMTSLKREFNLSNPEYGAYSVNGVNVWVMRAKATRIDHPNDAEIVEKAITVLPKGVIYWSGFFRNEDAQKEFEHIHLSLDNGGDSELIPASAFQNAAAADAAPTAPATAPKEKR